VTELTPIAESSSSPINPVILFLPNAFNYRKRHRTRTNWKQSSPHHTWMHLDLEQMVPHRSWDLNDVQLPSYSLQTHQTKSNKNVIILYKEVTFPKLAYFHPQNVLKHIPEVPVPIAMIKECIVLIEKDYRENNGQLTATR
jgi:hypothetical protein